jgi:uncharacterized protein (TIGR02147 family)
MTEEQSLDYRQILRREFEKRKTKNPKYSLRAYARYLGVVPSRLSEIFSGKRGLSPEVAASLVDKLDFSSFEKGLFIDLVESEHSRSKIDRQLAAERVQQKTKTYSEISIDEFEFIAHWYHFALIEYFLMEKASPAPEAICRYFGLDQETVNAALERLQRLKLIERHEDGHYVSCQRLYATAAEIPSEAIKSHHAEMLEKAITALRHQPVEQREFQALTLAVAEEDIPFVKKKIREFHDQLGMELVSSPHKNKVYVLLSNFFELGETSSSPGPSEELS